MKTQRIATIVLAVTGALSGAAYADPAGVTLYGVFDAAIGSVQHQGNTGDNFASSVNPFSPVKGTTITSGSPTNGVFNGGLQDSRWGLRGSEDLGNGTKAIFNLEAGFNLPTGQLNNNDQAVTAGGTTNAANSSLSGQLFNRQSYVGLQDDTYGKLTVGRNYMPIYDILTQYDNVQFGQLLSPLSFSGGFGGGIGISEDMRSDNSIKYSNTVGGFNFGALYKFGGVSGHNGANSDYALNVGYETGGFGIQGAYERLFDAIKAASSSSTIVPSLAAVPTAGCGTATAVTIAGKNYCETAGTTPVQGLNAQVYNSVGYLIALKYKFNDPGVTVRGGFSKYDLTNGDLTTSQMGLTQLYGNVIANGTTSNQTLAAGSTASTRLAWLGGDYKVSDANMFSLGLYRAQVDGDAKYGATTGDGGQNQYTARYYSFLYDHNMSKRTDLYAGALFSQYSDFGTTLSEANAYTSNRLLMVGLRHKF